MNGRPVCLSAVLVMGFQGATVQPPPAGSQDPHPRYVGFILAPGRCDAGATDCALRTPKPWTAGDIDTVKRAIDAIAASPMGKAIIERAQRRGFLTLERYASGGIDHTSGAPYPAPGPAASLHRNLYSIHLYDQFFAKRGRRDAFSGQPGYLLVAQILLHECFHAIDRVSATADFQNLVGFRRAGSKVSFAARTEADVYALTQSAEQLKRRTPSGDAERHWRASRALALGMKPVRVPSMLSVQSPAQAFAEIGSHLLLDPRARTYLPPETTAYFDQHVLR